MSQDQRAAQRHLLGSWGRYAVEGEPAFQQRRWERCRVIEVSDEGAALELFAVPTKVAVGGRLLIELEVRPDEILGVQLCAEVRNIAPGSDGGLRVGTRLVEPTVLQLSLLKQLSGNESPGVDA